MSTKNSMSAGTIARPLTLGLALFAASGMAALAQDQQTTTDTFDPAYDTITTWQPAWETDAYDHRHVLVGTIAASRPYRVLLESPAEGHAIAVDLKNGTVISPEGTTLIAGMRVAMMGYWSKGTFIANRVVLHA